MPRQDGLIDELRACIEYANREGMYDAADYLAEVVGRAEERVATTGGGQ